MLSALVLVAALSSSGIAADGHPAESLRRYEQARAALGRDAEGHVRLALWCEQHGLTAERVKHLALAVLNDPANPTARGLLGLVSYQGQWERPEKIAESRKGDRPLNQRLSEYNARRDRIGENAEAHWKLALWCEANDLRPEAVAHFTVVTRLDPSREGAWKKLGLKKSNGRWVREEQLAAERAEARMRESANKSWRPLLAKYRDWLKSPANEKRTAAETELASLTDPLAVPAICVVFLSRGKPGEQLLAIPVLGRIDGPAASRALAVLAVYGASPEVTRQAAEVLRRRDARDVMTLLIGLLARPLNYEVRSVNGPNLPGELYVDGERAILRRVYLPAANIATQLQSLDIALRRTDSNVVVPQAAAVGTTANADPLVQARNEQSARLAAQRALAIQIAQERISEMLAFSHQQLANDVAMLDERNAATISRNARVEDVLHALTGKDLGQTPERWTSWWADEQGYAYETPTEPVEKPIVSEQISNPIGAVRLHHSCFGAGTLVRTIEGPRAIESIRVGDQVLAQDPKTGRLLYTPVVAAYHNKPASTLRVQAADETIVVTGIHRFWKAGHGWTMARDLRPGDPIRTLGGTARVAAVETDNVQPVYNLEVAEGQSFFVGGPGLLVHDNSMVTPVTQPFDAAAELASRP